MVHMQELVVHWVNTLGLKTEEWLRIVCEVPETLWVGFMQRTRLRCGLKGCIVRVWVWAQEGLGICGCVCVLCRVSVWLCRGVTCVDVMAAAMHGCSHQRGSKQTWQRRGKKRSNHCWSAQPLPLFLFLTPFRCLLLCSLPLAEKGIFKNAVCQPVCSSVAQYLPNYHNDFSQRW